jgi:HAD superfamily hydrolase (TIGR01450 family)
MSGYRAALVDLDGTVWRGSTILPGAAEGLSFLADRGLDLRYVTNGTALPSSGVRERLEAAGLPAGGVTTAASAAASLLANRGVREAFVLADGAVAEELEAAGLTARKREAPDGADADAVVAGITRELGFDRLTRALRAFDEDTLFVATNTDPTTPGEDGLEPGAGAVVGAVEGMVEEEPLVAGKPSQRLAGTVLEDLGVPPEDCLIVGDSLRTDVLMGERAGMTTVLVLSGVTDQAALADASLEPDHVVESLAGLRQLPAFGG